jgi:hypothetical protein
MRRLNSSATCWIKNQYVYYGMLSGLVLPHISPKSTNVSELMEQSVTQRLIQSFLQIQSIKQTMNKWKNKLINQSDPSSQCQ